MFMKKPYPLKTTANKSGRIAELMCRMYMRIAGYRIIAKNYRFKSGRKTMAGELDFIALKGKTIVFCEVKERQDARNFLFALSYKQQQRILTGGACFIRDHPQYKNYSIRFDVFFVQLPFYINRIKNALYIDSVR